MERKDTSFLTFILGVAAGVAAALIYRENKTGIDRTVKKAVDSTVNKSHEVVDNVKSKTHDVKNKVGDKLYEAADSLKDNMNHRVDDMNEFIEDTKNSIK